MDYRAEDYKFNGLQGWEDFKQDPHVREAFPIEEVFDAFGIPALGKKYNEFGFRCADPIHGGKNETSMQVYTDPHENYAWSHIEHTGYKVWELVIRWNNYPDRLAMRALIDLCNHFGYDPTEFTGVVKRDYVQDSGYVKKEEKKSPVTYTKNQKAMLGLSDVDIFKRPFVNKTVDKKTVTIPLTEKQCSTVIRKAMSVLSSRMDRLWEEMKDYKEHSIYGKSLDNVLKKSYQTSINHFLTDTVSWYKDLKASCDKVGYERIPEEVLDSKVPKYKDPYIEKLFSKDIASSELRDIESFEKTGQNALDASFVEMEVHNMPAYPFTDDIGPVVGASSLGIMVFNGRAYCPPMNVYVDYNLERLDDYMDHILRLQKMLHTVVAPYYPADRKEDGSIAVHSNNALAYALINRTLTAELEKCCDLYKTLLDAREYPNIRERTAETERLSSKENEVREVKAEGKISENKEEVKDNVGDKEEETEEERD